MEPAPQPQQTSPQSAPPAPVQQAPQPQPAQMPNAAPQPAAQAPAMAAPAQPKLKFQITGPMGEHAVDEQYVAQQLGQAGYNVAGLSPDGSKITIQGPQGVQDMTIQEALQGMGWQVSRVTPLTADYENVQLPWRAAITKFSDDDEREAYLTAKLKRAGIKEPQLMGSGRDWHVYNPTTSSWIGLTNNPEWDVSDVAEAAVELPRMIGAGAGAAMAGIGSMGLGAAAGGAAGGAVGDTLTRGMLAMDDDYKSIAFDQNLASTGGDILKNAAIDAVGTGVVGAAGKYLTKLSPFSSTLKGVGGAAEGTGATLAGASKMAQSGLAKDFLPFMMPGLETPATIGALGQLPSQGVKFAAKAPGAIHNMFNSRIMKKAIGPRAAQAMRSRLEPLKQFSAGIQQLRHPKISDIGKMTDDPTAGDIFGNIAEKIGGKFAARSEENYARKAMSKAIDDALASGKTHSQAYGIARDAYQQAQDRLWKGAAKAGDVGESFGRGVEGIGNLGKGLEGLSRGAYMGGTYAGRGIGKGMEYGGRAARWAGTPLKPAEPYMHGAYGAEYLMGPGAEESRGWRFPKNRRNIKPPNLWAGI